jgi:three-Cys-motif partner protein
MTKPLGTIWPLEPHTAKKHEILRRYFQAWLPILAQHNPRLLYIDAFAGPGEYLNGEDGSPVVILKAARDHVIPFRSELVCLFIESEEDRHKHLVEVLERIKPTRPACDSSLSAKLIPESSAADSGVYREPPHAVRGR